MPFCDGSIFRGREEMLGVFGGQGGGYGQAVPFEAFLGGGGEVVLFMSSESFQEFERVNTTA